MRTALSIPFVVGLFAASVAAQLGAVDNTFDGMNLLDKITALKEPSELDFDKRGDVWVPANGFNSINGLRKKKPKKQASASASASGSTAQAPAAAALKVVDTQMDLNAPNAGVVNVAAPAVAAAAVTTVAIVGVAAGQATPAYQPVVGGNGLPLFVGAGHDQPTPTFTPDSLDALKSRLAAKMSQLQATPDADLTTVTIDARSNRLHDGEAEFPHLKRGDDGFNYKADGNGNIIPEQAKPKKPKKTTASSTAASSPVTQKVLVATNALAAANKAPIGQNTFSDGGNILVVPAANTAAPLADQPVYNTVPGAPFVGFGHDRPTPTFVPSLPTGLLNKAPSQRMAKVKRDAKEVEA